MSKVIQNIIIGQLQGGGLFYPFVADLTMREKAVLEMRRSKTLEEVGEKFGVSRERVRQIEEKANDKLAYQLRLIETLADEISKSVFTEEEIENAFSDYLKTKKIASEVAEIKVFWTDFNKLLWKQK